MSFPDFDRKHRSLGRFLAVVVIAAGVLAGLLQANADAYGFSKAWIATFGIVGSLTTLISNALPTAWVRKAPGT